VSRQSKRMMRRGAQDADGQAAFDPPADEDLTADLDVEEALDAAPIAAARGGRSGSRAKDRSRPSGGRLTPARLAREVRNELRQVVWPNSSELVNYTTVVLTVLVIMIALIFVLNLAFGKAVLYLFQK
jgi:preprotein translocase subunit SecE